MPHLIQWMKRTPSSGRSGKRRLRADPKDEPNFYDIGLMYPIQDYYSQNGGVQVSVSKNTQEQEDCSAGNQGRESSYDISRKDNSFANDEIYSVLQDHHSSPWNYKQQNSKRDDVVYHPSSPKKKRSDSHSHSFILRDQEINVDDFWGLPTNHQRHKDDHHCSDRGHCRAYHESATPSSRCRTDESSQNDFVAASKNHWQSFCDAILQPEQNENQTFSGRDNTVQFNNSTFSADLEPHSIYDVTPAVPFDEHDSDGNHNEWLHNQHTVQDGNDLPYE